MSKLLRMCLENNSEIALEGFIDSIKKFFDKKISVNKKDTQYSSLSSHIIETVKQTLTNRAWVTRNILDKPVKLSDKDLWYLIIDFKVLEPNKALDELYQTYEREYKKYYPVLKKFAKDQEDALKKIEEFYKKNKDVDKVESFANDLISKISIPKVPDVYEEYNKEIIDKKRKILQEASGKTYSLTVDEIVELANKIIQIITSTNKDEYYIAIGSDFDEDFWSDYEHGDDAGEVLRTGKIGDFFYEQALPEKLSMVTASHRWNLESAVRSVLKLLIKSVKSTHDFDD